jgi:hypothetical protein
MHQLTDTLPNFSCMQMETNYVHARNGHMHEVGWGQVVHGWLWLPLCYGRPGVPIAIYIYWASNS